MWRRAAFLALLTACARPRDPADPAAESAAPRAASAPLSLDLTLLDGKRLTSADLAGRLTLVAFLASYDTASQAEAHIVAAVVTRHKPRVNGLGIALEPATNRPLVEAFAQALELPYPVAMADDKTLAGEGPFAGLHHVPALVLLDREGREVWRYFGVATAETLEAVLAREGH